MFVRKIVRRVYGQIKENDECRIRNDKEVDEAQIEWIIIIIEAR